MSFLFHTPSPSLQWINQGDKLNEGHRLPCQSLSDSRTFGFTDKVTGSLASQVPPHLLRDRDNRGQTESSLEMSYLAPKIVLGDA